MLTYTHLAQGIPLFYYGTESLLKGGQDPLNREVFDPLHHPIDKTIEHHIVRLNKFRRARRTFEMKVDFREVEGGFISFTLGSEILVVLTNT
jgi:glycosidase